MNIWVVTTGEPLPVDPANERLLRSGILCQQLADRGHDVTWWTSTFIHMKKRHIAHGDEVVELSERYRLRMLRGTGYRRNVSIARLFDHWIVARKFARDIRRQPLPDLILCSFPTIELSAAAVDFGAEHRLPVVLDIRDLWPDIFSALAPSSLKPISDYMLTPYARLARRAIRGATAIVAINEGFVDWAMRRGGRVRGDLDRAFPMGYPSAAPPQHAIDVAKARWKERGVESDEMFTAIFVGNIGRQFEFEAIAAVARKTLGRMRFILCGTGDAERYVRRLMSGLSNVFMPGWVSAKEIWTLMRIADVGLAPYHAEESFTHSLPNKSLEYLSAGLPIVSSLPGALARLLMEEDCGLTYANNNAEELEVALETLAKSVETRRRMQKNAARIFAARFSAERIYSDMADYLERVARVPSSHLSCAQR